MGYLIDRDFGAHVFESTLNLRKLEDEGCYEQTRSCGASVLRLVEMILAQYVVARCVQIRKVDNRRPQHDGQMHKVRKTRVRVRLDISRNDWAT